MAGHAAIPVAGRSGVAGTADFANGRLEWRRLLAEAGTVDPTDGLEVRWIAPGPLTTAMRRWFARFPVGTEARDDIYLLHPPLRGLAVKLRCGSTLDLKAFLGSPGLIELPNGGCGTLELWRKWSFSGDNCALGADGGDRALGWAAVHKKRIGAWFPLPSGAAAEPGDRHAVQTGCAVELTEINLSGACYVSVGFEARGAPQLLRPVLEHAIGLVFALAPPVSSGFSFSLDNCQSYAQWLDQQRPCQAALA